MAKGRLAVGLGMVAALCAGPADAAFIAYLCNDVACAGGGDLVVQDQSATPDGDFNPVVGVINANGVVGGLTTAVNVAQSKPVIGSAAAPQLDLGFVATGTGEVWLYASDTDFTAVTPFRLQIGGTSTGSPIFVEANAGGGGVNTNLTPGSPLIASLGPFTSSPFTGEVGTGFVGVVKGPANQYTGPANGGNPYSLTLGVHVIQNGGTTTGNANLNVPEPASALLLGMGLLGLGLGAAAPLRMSVDVVVRLSPVEWARTVALWKNRAAWWALAAAVGWVAAATSGLWMYLGCGR